MISTSDQDGCQPPASTQPSLPATGIRNVANTDQREICRNYVWGTCNKGAACKFRHVFDFENMKKTLKFCHDYQNRTSCTREGCSYLHATKEEQTLFLATGKLPKVLADRHANMTMSSAETIPQIAMYIQESLAGPPPPPPPVATQPATSTATGPVQPTSAIGQMPPQIISMGPMAPPRMAMGPMLPAAINMGPMIPPMMSMSSTIVAPPPPVLPMQHLPPPPPPPTQPVTVPQSTPPVYTAPPPPAISFPLNQPPPAIPPKFDASKPPPRLPQVQNGTLKRSSPNEIEAGPSKVRKEGESLVDEPRCEYCQQRQLRIDVYKKEMEKLYAREEFQMLIYKKKVDECQKRKEILKTLISPDLYKLIDDYIEEGPQVHEPMNQNVLSNDRHLLVQVLDYFMNNDRTLPTSPRIDETLRTLLTTRSSTISNTKPDTFMSFIELLSDVNQTEKDEKSNDIKRIVTTNTKNDYGYGNTTSRQEVQTPFSKSQSVSTATTNKTSISVTGSKATGASTTVVTLPSYPVYNMPPPMTRPYMPQTSMPVASTLMPYSQHNGGQGLSQSVAKPATCVPPPPPNNQKSQNTVSYPPPTPYYNPYQ